MSKLYDEFINSLNQSPEDNTELKDLLSTIENTQNQIITLNQSIENATRSQAVLADMELKNGLERKRGFQLKIAINQFVSAPPISSEIFESARNFLNNEIQRTPVIDGTKIPLLLSRKEAAESQNIFPKTSSATIMSQFKQTQSGLLSNNFKIQLEAQKQFKKEFEALMERKVAINLKLESIEQQIEKSFDADTKNKFLAKTSHLRTDISEELFEYNNENFSVNENKKDFLENFTESLEETESALANFEKSLPTISIEASQDSARMSFKR